MGVELGGGRDKKKKGVTDYWCLEASNQHVI